MYFFIPVAKWMVLTPSLEAKWAKAAKRKSTGGKGKAKAPASATAHMLFTKEIDELDASSNGSDGDDGSEGHVTKKQKGLPARLTAYLDITMPPHTPKGKPMVETHGPFFFYA